jgi:zinc finger FYVE domain-containing protein 1
LEEETKNVQVRKYGEVLASVAGKVVGVLDYPKELIKDSVRPDYWVKDSDALSCNICDQRFANSIDEMEQSKLRELNGSSSSFQNSPIHSIDFRRHHVS